MSNSLPVLEYELKSAQKRIVDSDGAFYQLREKTREIALEYPQYIVWSPDLVDGHAMTEVWDHAWNRLSAVKVQVSQKMVNDPMW